MADYFQYKHTSNSLEAYNAVKEKITPSVLEKFKVKAKVDYDDDKHKIFAKGKGFSLQVDFLDDKALVDLNLSLLLKPLKGTVLSMIEKEIATVL